MKKVLALAVLFGVSVWTLTFAQETTTTTTDEGSSETTITTTGAETTTGKKAKRQEKRNQQLQKKEQIMQKKAVKVGARAERLRGIIAKINNGFLTSLLTQIDHLIAKAKTEESKVMIWDIKLLIQDKLGLLSGSTVEDPTGTGSTVTPPTDEDEDEDETEDETEDEDEDETETSTGSTVE